MYNKSEEPNAKLQTEQWVIGSDPIISLIPLSILIAFSALFFFVSIRLLRKLTQEQCV